MIRRSTLWFTAAIATVAAACQPAAAPLSEQDVAEIEQLPHRWADAAMAGDVNAALALYAEDAIEMPPNAAAVEGRMAIRSRLEREFPGLSQIQHTPLEVDGQGDVAWSRGAYTFTGTPPGQTEPVSGSGKWIVVLHKEADGWKIHRLIWNVNEPAP